MESFIAISPYLKWSGILNEIHELYQYCKLRTISKLGMHCGISLNAWGELLREWSLYNTSDKQFPIRMKFALCFSIELVTSYSYD